MNRLKIILVAAMVVLAGCPGNTTDSPTPETAGDQSTVGSGSGSATIVAVNTSIYTSEKAVSITRESISFWQQSKYADEFSNVKVRPDAENPDIVVKYAPTVQSCNGEVTNDSFTFCSETGDPGQVTVPTPFTEEGIRNVSKVAIASHFGIDDPWNASGVTPKSELRYSDPWLEPGPVTIRINDTGADNPERYRPLVEQSVEYWEKNDDTYGNYTANLSLRPDAESADIEVRFVEEITDCDTEDIERVIGCAPLYNGTGYASGTTLIEVETGYTNETTLSTLKHEFGHVYGRHHGMEPMPLMNETNANATYLPQPNATERTNPWQNQTLSVYIDYESFSTGESELRPQVKHALNYYENGADGHAIDGIQFELTSPNTSANITIVGGKNPCRPEEDGSCGGLYGSNIDTDQSLEFYNRQEIFINGIDDEAVGWHVGYWLGYSIGLASNQSELPEKFRDADYDDRRSW